MGKKKPISEISVTKTLKILKDVGDVTDIPLIKKNDLNSFRSTISRYAKENNQEYQTEQIGEDVLSIIRIR